MLKLLFKNWWVLLLKGILLVLFGILAFVSPGITLATLVIWFSIYMMIDGAFSIFGAISNWKTEEDKWLLLAEGAIGLMLGFLIYRSPGTFVSFIAFIISFWSIFLGISRIAMAIQLRKEIKGEGWLILMGLLSIVFGIIVFTQPAVGIATLMWMIGFFALLIGLLFILLSFKLRKAGKNIGNRVEEIKSGLQNLNG